MKNIAKSIGLCLLSAAPAAAQSADELLASRFRAAEALIEAQLSKEAAPGAAIGRVDGDSLDRTERARLSAVQEHVLQRGPGPRRSAEGMRHPVPRACGSTGVPGLAPHG